MVMGSGRCAAIMTASVIIAVSTAGQATAQGLIATMMFKPHHGFAEEQHAAAPDYTSNAAWAALPGADEAGTGAAQATNVFFLHPTTYLSPESWNAAFDNPGRGVGGSGVDATLRNQASAFAKCCRIFAPRYRQATLFAFLDTAGDGVKAIDLAYQDIDRAFDVFLARNGGKPFIIAGHSQGSIHLLRLVQQRIAGKPEEKLLIAAYAIGAAVPADFKAIPPCADATQTGCLASWNSVSDANYDRSRGGQVPIWLNGRYDAVGARRLMCTNPLDWHLDSAAPASANHGSLSPNGPNAAPTLKVGYAPAKCVDGQLVVELPADRPDFKGLPGQTGSFHIYDYNLFYANLQENAALRATGFASKR
jgi:hypothetical protein